MKIQSGIPMLLVLLSGCLQQDPRGTASPAPIAGSQRDDQAWTRALVEHREEIDEDYRTSVTSPMAGTQYLKSEPTDRVYLTRQDKAFAFAYSADPTAEIAVTRRGKTWVWEDLGGDVVCATDQGGALASGAPLEGPATFAMAGLHLGFYPAEDRVTFIVYDPEREEKRSFDHLLYYPPDRDYAVRATLFRVPEPDVVEMLTSQGLKKTYYRYARIRFRLDGEDRELTAFKSKLTGEGSDSLFIPFRDATSGRETYGAGRFLDVDEPAAEDFVLDFNRAYNPLCNYSPAFNCPIPPRENHLEVAIRAGERTYPTRRSPSDRGFPTGC
jgi:uncharacterized protein (DUF1684 family)